MNHYHSSTTSYFKKHTNSSKFMPTLVLLYLKPIQISIVKAVTDTKKFTAFEVLFFQSCQQHCCKLQVQVTNGNVSPTNYLSIDNGECTLLCTFQLEDLFL